MAAEKWAELLGETAELFRITVENLPINLVLYDRDYRILYMNPQLATTCAALCKRTPGELVGMRGSELWPQPIWDPLFENTERAVAGRARPSAEHAPNQPRRGPTVGEGSGGPRGGAGGDVDRMLAISIDVTEQRRMVQELREADQRKSDFIAVLSHELRNPLAAIRLSLDVMEHGAPGSEEAVGARRIIDRQVGQLVHLIDDLLDVTRVTQNKIHLQRHRLDLNALVRATIDDNRRHLERDGVRVDAKLASAPVTIDADGVRIAQVLTNLLANAVKYTPPGGTATVSVSSDLHGGRVSAHSAGKGQGAEFVVSLPLAAEAALDARASTAASPARARRRVLVIEDAADVAAAMRLVLEMDGHQVTVAHNGPDGVVAALALRPEVVLCDIGLPGMDGYAVARTMRADPALRDAFLVALSGYTQSADIVCARAAGFDEHIAKPPSIDKVRRILDTLQTR